MGGLTDVTDLLWEDLTACQDETFNQRASTLRYVAHYTSFAALKSIIEGEEMWFSSASTMNDFDEITRGKQLLQEMTADGGALYDTVLQIKMSYPAIWDQLNYTFRQRLADDLFHTYLSCWSECSLDQRSYDDLTMWRGYASDGNGVAIVIDAHALGLNDSFRSAIIACPVFYEDHAGFANRAKRAFSLFEQGLRRNTSAALQHLDLVANAFGEVCFYLAVTHKHPGFRAEKEWRFAWRKHLSDANEGFQAYLKPVLARDELIEKFCFPVRQDPRVSPAALQMKDIIKSIIVGPCDDSYLKVKAVQSLLTSKEYPSSLTMVEASPIPYRSLRR